MKLKMLISLAGTDFALSPNDETERFAGEEAKGLVDAGYAVPVAKQKVERGAKKPAPETRG